MLLTVRAFCMAGHLNCGCRLRAMAALVAHVTSRELRRNLSETPERSEETRLSPGEPALDMWRG